MESLAPRLDPVRVDLLEQRVAVLERTAERSIFCIDTFAPEPFTVVKPPLHVTVLPQEDEFLAVLADAELSAMGGTQVEAIANLKDLLLQMFERLVDEPDAKLGPRMRRKKAVLKALISRG